MNLIKVKVSTLFLVAILLQSLTLRAQAPVVHNMEKYVIGNSAIIAVISPVPASGPAGASELWDFSTLSFTDTLEMSVQAAIGSPFAGVSYQLKYSNYLISYIFSSSTGTALIAVVDSSPSGGGQATYHSPALVTGAVPINYGMSFNAAFNTLNADLSLQGSGIEYFRVDGYGTLKTPAGTFPNVLRVKDVCIEADSVVGYGIKIYDTTVSYLWYDDLHPEALMRIDSVKSSQVDTTDTLLTSKQSAQYLFANATGISDETFITERKLTAFFMDNILVVNGELEAGKECEIHLINTSGQVLYSGLFLPVDNSIRVSLPTLSAGMYFAEIRQVGRPDNKKFIKLVKQ